MSDAEVLRNLPTSPGDLREEGEPPADRVVALVLLAVAQQGCIDVRQEPRGKPGTGPATLARAIQIVTGWPRARVDAALAQLREEGSANYVAPERLVRDGRG